MARRRSPDRPSFNERVYAAVCTVPEGWVTTYGDVAAVLGSPRAARQVGWALSALRESDRADTIPWQRVINAQGSISVRGDGLRATDQQARLEEEGIEFDAALRCDLEDHRWMYPDVRAALDKLE
jgi:methylated-DNA-protein-cysteine methyltransferase-like protein